MTCCDITSNVMMDWNCFGAQWNSGVAHWWWRQTYNLWCTTWQSWVHMNVVVVDTANGSYIHIPAHRNVAWMAEWGGYLSSTYLSMYLLLYLSACMCMCVCTFYIITLRSHVALWTAMSVCFGICPPVSKCSVLLKHLTVYYLNI